MQEILIDGRSAALLSARPTSAPRAGSASALDGKVDWNEVHALLADAWRA